MDTDQINGTWHKWHKCLSRWNNTCEWEGVFIGNVGKQYFHTNLVFNGTEATEQDMQSVNVRLTVWGTEGSILDSVSPI